MRTTLLLAIFALTISLTFTQKLSEEEPLEGSGQLINPDDEDFEASGLPPEDDENQKPSSVRPQFVTETGAEIKNVVQTEAPPTIVTRRPAADPESSPGNNLMIIIAIVVIVGILILVGLIICCCRKRKSQNEYTAGQRTAKDYI
uniref:Uncharacterized protein n=1 Tax=Panagrolaimus sp. JU765 TaxID=591449 RepID=A0AC34PV49_9BILA